jgi:hypothetical protein
MEFFTIAAVRTANPIFQIVFTKPIQDRKDRNGKVKLSLYQAMEAQRVVRR